MISMMQVVKETDRWILREILPEDEEGMFALDSDPEVHRYLGNTLITTREQAILSITKIRDQYLQYGIGRWAVIDRESGDFMGWSGLKYELAIRPDPYFDLGYRLRREHWGKGIATETSRFSLEYGFRVLGLDVIHAGAHIDNLASNRVLQKLGFQYLEIFHFGKSPIRWYAYTREHWESLVH